MRRGGSPSPDLSHRFLSAWWRAGPAETEGEDQSSAVTDEDGDRGPGTVGVGVRQGRRTEKLLFVGLTLICPTVKVDTAVTFLVTSHVMVSSLLESVSLWDNSSELRPKHIWFIYFFYSRTDRTAARLGSERLRPASVWSSCFRRDKSLFYYFSFLFFFFSVELSLLRHQGLTQCIKRFKESKWPGRLWRGF